MKDSKPDTDPDQSHPAVERWLRKRTGWSTAVFAKVWAHPDMEAAVDGYVYAGDLPPDLLRAAKEIWARLFSKTRPKKEKDPRANFRPTMSEFAQAEVFSTYLGRLARKLAAQFRRKVLKDKLLTRDEALVVLNSPLCARANFWFFEKHGIPLAAHSAHEASLEIYRTESGHSSLHAQMSISWNNGSLQKEVKSLAAYRDLRDCMKPLYWTEHGRGDEYGAVVWDQSVLDELRELSVLLARRFPWTPAAAAWFVLTGKAPLIHPAYASTSRWFDRSFAYYQITISAQPWVDEQTIVDLFRAQRDQIRIGGNRKAGEKALAFMKFFLSRDWDKNDPDVMEKIRREWNDVHCKDRPDLHYTASALRTALPRNRLMFVFQQSLQKPIVPRDSPRSGNQGAKQATTKKKRRK